MFEGKRLSNQKLKVAVSMTALSKKKKEFIMRSDNVTATPKCLSEKAPAQHCAYHLASSQQPHRTEETGSERAEKRVSFNQF